VNPEKAEGLSSELQAALQPLLAAIGSVSERITEYNQRIENLAQESYPQVGLLKQVKGVGTLIALTFLLTLEDPHRFSKSRDVGGYLGLRQGEGTLARASHRCTSARKATRICGPCWCKGRSIS
jgi:transposase